MSCFRGPEDPRKLKKEKEVKRMNLLYKSTRSADKTVTASEAILKGLADDGGLFVPEYIPKLDVTLDELKNMTCLLYTSGKGGNGKGNSGRREISRSRIRQRNRLPVR